MFCLTRNISFRLKSLCRMEWRFYDWRPKILLVWCARVSRKSKMSQFIDSGCQNITVLYQTKSKSLNNADDCTIVMATVTEQTEKYILEHRSIKECLKKGIINYSSLARLIQKALQPMVQRYSPNTSKCARSTR